MSLASLTEDMNPKELEKQLYHPASGLHTSLDTLYNLLGALPHEADLPQHQQHLLQSSGSSWPESSTPDRWAMASALALLCLLFVKASAAGGFHRCAAHLRQEGSARGCSLPARCQASCASILTKLCH